jgi:ubiquinone/menaquinone biosynthesis C-methylase UbiE
MERDEQAPSFDVNIHRFRGFASTYDQYRPTPPAVICDILSTIVQAPRPTRVVDLGSGTGLSTRIWAERADEVIGIEPSEDMRHQAEQLGTAPNLSYRDGLSHATRLEGHAADIVTCSQSLHWMDPKATFTEAARILRPGGLFAAVDCDWPPVTPSWQVDAAYTEFMIHVSAVERQRHLSEGLQRWSKDRHLERMQASGRFRLTREIAVHSVEAGTADRYIGLALSQGGLQTVLKAGISQEEIGLDRFGATAHRLLGDVPKPWYFTYRVRIGIV